MIVVQTESCVFRRLPQHRTAHTKKPAGDTHLRAFQLVLLMAQPSAETRFVKRENLRLAVFL